MKISSASANICANKDSKSTEKKQNFGLKVIYDKEFNEVLKVVQRQGHKTDDFQNALCSFTPPRNICSKSFADKIKLVFYPITNAIQKNSKVKYGYENRIPVPCIQYGFFTNNFETPIVFLHRISHPKIMYDKIVNDCIRYCSEKF